jgi:hypothetical protein
MTTRISRRMMLKGLGTAVALPFLEAMMPSLAAAGQAAAKKAPKRMAFCYVPNGMNMQHWTPAAEGPGYELPDTLKPLEPLKEDLLVLSSLTHDKARANGDGPGDHARAMSTFLTGVQIKKTDGANIRAGISVDQVAALKIGQHTRFPSLEIGCEGGKQVGGCDSGYSCAYSANLSWRGESTPMIKETNPRLVFERLFASGARDEADAARRIREKRRKSVLDFVAEDAGQLMMRLGSTDQKKMDEYLTSIREIEKRLVKSTLDLRDDAPKGVDIPTGIPRDYADHLRLMADMLVLAFQGDLTRVSTFVFANDGSNRNYRLIEVPEGHHDLSHHGGNKEKLEKIKKINTFHVNQFAYMLQKMKAIREGDGTLLDNCMIVYGGGIGDGNRHNHDNLPILLAGKGAGTIKSGRHIRYPSQTPLANLFLSMLERIEVPTEKLGDSTGLLEGLS